MKIRVYAEKALTYVTTHGILEISEGVWLVSAEFALADQEKWYGKDKCKNFDFSTAEFYVLADESKPIEIRDAKDLIELLQKCELLSLLSTNPKLI